MTSALLKLPQKLSRAKKEERVEQILEELVRVHACQQTPYHGSSTVSHLAQARCRKFDKSCISRICV